MEWYSRLYIGEGAKPKAKKIIRKLKRNAGQMDIYLITLASNGKDILEIINAAYLKQSVVRRNLPMIVGIAKGYGEAVELVQQLVTETYEKTGDCQVLAYLKWKAKTGSGKREWQE